MTSASSSPEKGSLSVVGIGIQAYSQLTAAARESIEQADIVFSLVTDPLSEIMLRELNPELHTLRDLYGLETHRLKTYKRMGDRILEAVRAGKRTCAAFYGHPGVFATTPHAVVRIARDEGFAAEMLPAVSAEDCLIADLGIDPGVDGLQSFEATDFLLHGRKPDTRSPMILWQIAFIGVPNYPGTTVQRKNLGVLAAVLCEIYGPAHPCIVYEAPSLPGFAPVQNTLTLGALGTAEVSGVSTLYVPRLAAAVLDEEMALRLGMTEGSNPTCLR